MRIRATFALLLVLCFENLTARGDDGNGYLLFCPCMGRFGNQMETYLGTLNFAKALDRTLVLAPFLEYPYGEAKAKVVPFTQIFEVEPLQKFHRVATMEEFITKVAPEVWPVDKREVLCWGPRQGLNNANYGCHAKEGNPFGPFWDYYDVDFKTDQYFGEIGYDVSNPAVVEQWKSSYPPEKYPVLAFSSAPASFPMRPADRQLQTYFKWSTRIRREAEEFVKMHLHRPFVGIHLRNNVDWESACKHVESDTHFFASSQCTGDNFQLGRPSKEMCWPSEKQILEDVYRQVKQINAKSVYVSTDKDYKLSQLYGLFNRTLDIRRLHKDDPYVSLAILGLSDHLIANCMSTYSGLVVRQRLLSDTPYKSFSFFGFNQTQISTERTVRSDEDAKKQKDEL